MQWMFGDSANGPRNLSCFGNPRCLALVSWVPIEQLQCYLSTCRPAKHISRHFEFETGISEQGIPTLLHLARTATAVLLPAVPLQAVCFSWCCHCRRECLACRMTKARRCGSRPYILHRRKLSELYMYFFLFQVRSLPCDGAKP